MADGVFGSEALKDLNLVKKTNVRSTVNIKNNRIAVKSYGRRSLANVNMLAKRSQNLFTRETFTGNSGERGTMLTLESSGFRKPSPSKQTLSG